MTTGRSISRWWPVLRAASRFSESLTVLNHSDALADLAIRMEMGCDFADIFEVKNVRPRANARVWTEDNRLHFSYERGPFPAGDRHMRQ